MFPRSRTRQSVQARIWLPLGSREGVSHGLSWESAVGRLLLEKRSQGSGVTLQLLLPEGRCGITVD